MRKSLRTRFSGAVAVAIYAIAMLAVGFVRHDAGAATVEGVDPSTSIAYQLPGEVSLPFCGHALRAGEGIQPTGKQVPFGHDCCDACVVAHAPGIDWINSVAVVHRHSIAVAYNSGLAPAGIPIRRAEPTSRGPPAS